MFTVLPLNTLFIYCVLYNFRFGHAFPCTVFIGSTRCYILFIRPLHFNKDRMLATVTNNSARGKEERKGDRERERNREGELLSIYIFLFSYCRSKIFPTLLMPLGIASNDHLISQSEFMSPAGCCRHEYLFRSSAFDSKASEISFKLSVSKYLDDRSPAATRYLRLIY